MNLDEARDGIGRKVVYSPFAEPDVDDEAGVIDGVGDQLVFVRYGGQQQAKATNPGDLRFADERSGTGWEPRLAAHAAGAAPFKFARTRPGHLTLDELLEAVEVVDAYLDSHRSPEYIGQPLANDWARVTKVCEEAGEVWTELSRLTGENYRKGVCGSEDELLAEMADCVSAAMCGIQHRTKDTARTWAVVSAAFAKARQGIGEVPADDR